MYDGDKAVLTMVQYLKEDKEKDENIYEATVIEYQKEMEQVHLILRSGSLFHWMQYMNAGSGRSLVRLCVQG